MQKLQHRWVGGHKSGGLTHTRNHTDDSGRSALRVLLQQWLRPASRAGACALAVFVAALTAKQPGFAFLRQCIEVAGGTVSRMRLAHRSSVRHQ